MVAAIANAGGLTAVTNARFAHARPNSVTRLAVRRMKTIEPPSDRRFHSR